MILSFNPQFVPKILYGTKKQTIREDKKNRWKVKTPIHFATGVRTKNYKQFASSHVAEIKTIRIEYYCMDVFNPNHQNLLYLTETRAVLVFVNNKPLTINEIDTLAKDDGFDTTSDFFKWFDKDFTGKIIVWWYLIPSITNNL